MRLIQANRWSLAFADLSLLMLGFVVLSFVHPVPPASNMVTDNPEADLPSERLEWAASQLFEPGEAMLTKAGREEAEQVARNMNDRRVRIDLSVEGSASASARLDRWELSAARMASFARALRAAGVDESAIAFGEQSQPMSNEPQRLILLITHHAQQVTQANGTALASRNAKKSEE